MRPYKPNSDKYHFGMTGELCSDRHSHLLPSPMGVVAHNLHPVPYLFPLPRQYTARDDAFLQCVGTAFQEAVADLPLRDAGTDTDTAADHPAELLHVTLYRSAYVSLDAEHLGRDVGASLGQHMRALVSSLESQNRCRVYCDALSLNVDNPRTVMVYVLFYVVSLS